MDEPAAPAHEALDLRTSTDGTSFLISPMGALDLAAASRFRAAMRRATASGLAEVIVDLAGLTLIDSAGMRCLLELDERLERGGRRLLLLAGPPHVQYALHVCGLLHILTFTEG